MDSGVDDDAVAVATRLLGVQLQRQAEPLIAIVTSELNDRVRVFDEDGVLAAALSASIRDNVEAATAMVRYGRDVSDIGPLADAIEFARWLARRDVPPEVLTQLYRLAQAVILDWVLAQVVDIAPSSALAIAVARNVATISFRYSDTISAQVLPEYDRERERSSTLRRAQHAALLDELLAGHAPDATRTGKVLGYELNQIHLGAVLWTSEHATNLDEHYVLDAAAQVLSLAANPTTKPFIWSKSRSTSWMWIPLGLGTNGPEPAELDNLLNSQGVTTARIALGTPGPGPEGFRATHVEALRAQQVATSAVAAPRVVSLADSSVHAASLLAADPAGAFRLVQTTLGQLAHDTRDARTLRETLEAFLAEDCSYLAAGRRLHLHKNTVKYRIDKAVALLGKPIRQDRLNLELCLVACRWLGPRVLQASR